MATEAEDREFRRLSLRLRTAEVALARFQSAHTANGRFAIEVSEVGEYGRLSKDVELRTAERAAYALHRE